MGKKKRKETGLERLRRLLLEKEESDNLALYGGDVTIEGGGGGIGYVLVGLREWWLRCRGQVNGDEFVQVSGGKDNLASGECSTIGGGGSNEASGECSTIGGGDSNEASGEYSTIGGGGSNVASGAESTVGGGGGNIASEDSTVVGGGLDNTASGAGSAVGGGSRNEASGISAVVSGGDNNIASGSRASVLGGEENVVRGMWSAIVGGEGNSVGPFVHHAVILGGKSQTANQSNMAYAMGIKLHGYTTAQINALPSVEAGTIVYDSTKNKPVYYNGSAWVDMV